MSKKLNQTDIQILVNNKTFNDFYNRIKLIALSMFEWIGLPDSCNARFLERQLFEVGRCVYFDKSDLGHIISKVTDNKQLNHYDEPTGYVADSVTFHQELKPEECVIIRNNILEIPTKDTIELMCYRLYELQTTIDTNIKAQKTPVLIVGDDKSILTLKNTYMKYTGNEPVIYSDKNFNVNQNFTVLKTDAPFVADDLIKCKHEIMNECMSFLGLNNANTDKKERMITDEVNANNELIEMFLWVMLNTRQEACREIKEKFGVNVQVKVRDFKKDGEENEQIHSSTEIHN